MVALDQYKYWQPETIIVEAKASGQSLLQELSLSEVQNHNLVQKIQEDHCSYGQLKLIEKQMNMLKLEAKSIIETSLFNKNLHIYPHIVPNTWIAAGCTDFGGGVVNWLNDKILGNDDTDDISKLITEKRALYNYNVDQRKHKWSSNLKLCKISLDLLPKYIVQNQKKY